MSACWIYIAYVRLHSPTSSPRPVSSTTILPCFSFPLHIFTVIMPGSLKLALIATLAGLGAVSAQEPSRVPDKSVDFCSVVHKHSITQFYSDCSGIGTFPTPAPRVKPTNLPKFPYHSGMCY